MAMAQPRPRVERCTNSPQTQAAEAKTTKNNPNHNTPVPDSPKRPAVNQNNHIAVANIGKPMPTLKRTIQTPGFGKKRNQAGSQHNATNGNASPAPMATKNKRITKGG